MPTTYSPPGPTSYGPTASQEGQHLQHRDLVQAIAPPVCRGADAGVGTEAAVTYLPGTPVASQTQAPSPGNPRGARATCSCALPVPSVCGGALVGAPQTSCPSGGRRVRSRTKVLGPLPRKSRSDVRPQFGIREAASFSAWIGKRGGLRGFVPKTQVLGQQGQYRSFLQPADAGRAPCKVLKGRCEQDRVPAKLIFPVHHCSM